MTAMAALTAQTRSAGDAEPPMMALTLNNSYDARRCPSDLQI